MDMADSARNSRYDADDKQTATLDTQGEEKEDFVNGVVGIEGNSRFENHGDAAVDILSSSKTSYISIDVADRGGHAGNDRDDDDDVDKVEKGSSSSYVDFSEAISSVQGACFPGHSRHINLPHPYILTYLHPLSNM